MVRTLPTLRLPLDWRVLVTKLDDRRSVWSEAESLTFLCLAASDRNSPVARYGTWRRSIGRS